jgi:hypothetical protein
MGLKRLCLHLVKEIFHVLIDTFLKVKFVTIEAIVMWIDGTLIIKCA